MNLHASFIDWKKGSHLEGTLEAKFIYTPGRIYTMVLFPQATLRFLARLLCRTSVIGSSSHCNSLESLWITTDGVLGPETIRNTHCYHLLSLTWYCQVLTIWQVIPILLMLQLEIWKGLGIHHNCTANWWESLDAPACTPVLPHTASVPPAPPTVSCLSQEPAAVPLGSCEWCLFLW